VSASRTAQAVTAAFLSGLVCGAVVWSIQIGRSRRELFSRSPVRRLAALGYLSGQPGIETTRILTDYIGWERDPALRRRGQRVLRRMKASLLID